MKLVKFSIVFNIESILSLVKNIDLIEYVFLKALKELRLRPFNYGVFIVRDINYNKIIEQLDIDLMFHIVSLIYNFIRPYLTTIYDNNLVFRLTKNNTREIIVTFIREGQCDTREFSAAY